MKAHPTRCLGTIARAVFLATAMSLLPARARASSLEQVVVVFKTHFDIGYTDLASNVVQRYRTTMIDEALAVVDQNRELPPAQQFVWTIPGWPLQQIAADWPGQTAARQERVRAAFTQGRFVVHALPFTTHTELLEPEDLVRGLGFASNLSRAAGLDLPRDAKMTDVPCHSWILPTLLRHAGVDFLHLGCNAASSSPRVPPLFWWEGPDGSRLLTMYTAESYGTGLVPPANWPHRTWLALIHTGDNHGPPRPDEVKKLLAEANRRLPGVRVRIGRLSDFSDALLAEAPDLPVVRGDMPDTWIHGPLCDPAGAKLARSIRPEIATVEALGTLLGAWNVAAPEVVSTVARAYEQSLLYGEHTWGGALYWVSRYSAAQRLPYGDAWRALRAEGKYARIESSWAEHTAYIEQARDLIAPLLVQQVQALARATRGPNQRLVVYNPLPWKRSGVVTLPDRDRGGFWNEVMAADGSQTAALDRPTRGIVQFVAQDLPPMGYRVFGWGHRDGGPPSEIEPGATTIETRFFRATVDPERGTVRSLLDKRSQRELVDAAAPHGFGQYVYERFSSNEVQQFVRDYVKISADWATNELGKPNLPPAALARYRASSPVGWALVSQRWRAGVTATMTAPASAGLPAVTTRLTLYEELPYAELEVALHDKPADPWPEAGWVCLPFKVETPRFHVGRLGSIVDPARDIVRGANRHLLGVNTGVAITDPAGGGIGFCPLDSPLVSLDRLGCWKYSLDFVPEKPIAYVNVFNNQWTTNFRLWNSGTWTNRIRIWAFESGAERGATLVAPALEARYPLQVGWAQGAPGELPPAQAGVELERNDVWLTAFGSNPDGAGLLLRLWEQGGREGACRVRLPAALARAVEAAQPVDLRGRPLGDPIPVRSGQFVVQLRPYAPASFVLGAR